MAIRNSHLPQQQKAELLVFLCYPKDEELVLEGKLSFRDKSFSLSGIRYNYFCMGCKVDISFDMLLCILKTSNYFNALLRLVPFLSQKKTLVFPMQYGSAVCQN